MKAHSRLSLLFIAILGLCLTETAQAQQPSGYDPVTMDPEVVDWKHPPASQLLKIRSGEAELNAIFYEAGGAGPHPTVVLLQGYPGGVGTGDLVQVLRRAGYHVVFPHYRGTWGSGGSFSPMHALGDVDAVLRFLRSEAPAQGYPVDAERIVLVGHSFGGWSALMAAATDPAIECVASIAGVNLGQLARAAKASEEARAAVLTTLIAPPIDPESGPVRAANGQALLEPLLENPAKYDLLGHAAELSGRTLLLIAGSKDKTIPIAQHHTPLIQALGEANAQNVTEVVLEAGHSFATRRIALAHTLVNWLENRCGY